ncbi:MAG: DNA polymerase III subunit gamma/tau [Christensenellales bacterium]|jgi:DNA polymerase-3 subunit gamma/tau
MQYKALYRTYRPRRFEEVAGQEHIAPVLLRQCASGRLSHAYLFCGPRGTGKTSLALILARAVNCYTPQDGEPCLVCESCRAVNHVDIIEIDAASNNGVDEIRELREKVRFTPALGKRKVYVIDEVHMLTTGAFNALLKTLEEPPEHALFILATTEPNKLPATIISRCQRYDFRRIPHRVIVDRVRQVAKDAGLKVQDKALFVIASNAQGGLRDALSLLDQCAMMRDGEVTQEDVLRLLGASSVQSVSEVAEYILTSKPGEALAALDTALQGGRDIDVFLRDIAQYLRNMMLCACIRDPGTLIELDAEDLSRLQRLSGRNGMHSVLRCLHILIAAQNDMKYVSNPRIVLEAALVKAACAQEESDTEALLDRLERLEHKLDELQTNPIAALLPAEKPGKAKEAVMEQKEEKTQEAQVKPPEKTPAAPDAPGQESEQAGAVWDEILSRLMREEIGVYSLICSAKKYVFSEDTLRITFAPKDAVFCDSLKQEPNYGALSAVVGSVVGKKLELAIQCGGAQEEDTRADLGVQVVELLGEENVKFT